MNKILLVLLITFNIQANQQVEEINYGDINKGKSSLLPLLETQQIFKLDPKVIHQKIINEEISINDILDKEEQEPAVFNIDEEYLNSKLGQKEDAHNIDSEYLK